MQINYNSYLHFGHKDDDNGHRHYPGHTSHNSTQMGLMSVQAENIFEGDAPSGKVKYYKTIIEMKNTSKKITKYMWKYCIYS